MVYSLGELCRISGLSKTFWKAEAASGRLAVRRTSERGALVTSDSDLDAWYRSLHAPEALRNVREDKDGLAVQDREQVGEGKADAGRGAKVRNRGKGVDERFRRGEDAAAARGARLVRKGARPLSQDPPRLQDAS